MCVCSSFSRSFLSQHRPDAADARYEFSQGLAAGSLAPADSLDYQRESHGNTVTEQYFPAADISVTYALGLARRFGGIALGEIEQAYMSRIGGREAYKLVLSI
jgi:hypothetical protein